MTEKDAIPKAQGPYHYFWLFREGERTYEEYWDLLQRHDSTVYFSDDMIAYLFEPLQWVPTSTGKAFNPYGSNVFNHLGGEPLRNICSGWAQILSQGPETLILSVGWTRTLDEEGTETDVRYNRFQISRDALVKSLEKLAECAGLITSGDYFLFHLGP